MILLNLKEFPRSQLYAVSNFGSLKATAIEMGIFVYKTIFFHWEAMISLSI